MFKAIYNHYSVNSAFFWLHVIGLSILGILLYGQWLDSPIVFDDINFFTSNYISQYSSAFKPFASRFWPYASFAHEALFFGHTYHEMRVVNLAIHVLNALLIGIFISRLIVLSENNQLFQKHACFCSIICSCLFLLHPVSVYATAYLVQRSILMATLFSLAMWLSYLEVIKSGKARYLYLVAVFFYLAAFSKQQATLSLLVLPLISYLYWPQLRIHIQLRKLMLPLLLCMIVLAASISQSSSLIAKNYEPLLIYQPVEIEARNTTFLPEIYMKSILTQGKMFFSYLKLLTLPNPNLMSVDIRLGQVTAVDNWRNWVGMCAYLALSLIALMMLRKRKLLGIAGFGMLIFCTLFLTEFSTVRAQEVFVIYRSYLWMTGISITVGVITYCLAKRLGVRTTAIIFIPVLSFFFISSNQRLMTFSSEKKLWSDVIRLYEQDKPENSTFAERAYYARGLVLAKEGSYSAALTDINKSIALNPNYYLSYHAKGEVEFSIGKYEMALDSFQRVLKIRKNYSPSRISLAKTLIKVGKQEEGMTELDSVCKNGDISACFYLHKLMHPGTDFVYIKPIAKKQ